MIDTTTPIKQRLFNCLTSGVLLISYLLLGAFLFVKIEKRHGEENSTPEIRILNNITENMEALERTLKSIRRKDRSEEFEMELLMEYLNQSRVLVEELLTTTERKTLPWNLFTGIHFCLTAITTIGYGYITPVTQLGKGLCIPYMLVGIPINVYLSANLGFFVALGITKLYTCLSNLVNGKMFCFKTKTNTTISQPEVDLPTRDRGKRSSSGVSLIYVNSEITQQAETSMNNDVSESETCRSSVTIAEKIDLADPQDPPPTPGVLDGPLTTPLWFLLFVLVSFCSLVSLMCSYIFTKWTYLDSCYFVVATFTTVGFGDMDILVRGIDNQVNIWIVMVLMTVIMQIGLIVMAGTITLSAERLKTKAKRMRRLLKKKKNVISTISSIIS